MQNQELGKLYKKIFPQKRANISRKQKISDILQEAGSRYIYQE